MEDSKPWQFKKGMTAWNKGKHNWWKSGRKKGSPSVFQGRKHTLESRLKMSQAHKGMKKPWVAKANTKYHSGENNNHWKGGITSQDKLERRRFHKEIQRQILERDDYTCQMCKQYGGTLQVDHIQPWAEYVELRFSIDNCRTLCMKCHYKITFGKPMPENIKHWGLGVSIKNN